MCGLRAIIFSVNSMFVVTSRQCGEFQLALIVSVSHAAWLRCLRLTCAAVCECGCPRVSRCHVAVCRPHFMRCTGLSCLSPTVSFRY